jgi:hypothetical protein
MCDVLNPFYFYSLSDFPRPWMTSLFTGRWENLPVSIGIFILQVLSLHNQVKLTCDNFNKMNCELMLTYDTPALRQTGSRNLTHHPSVQDIFRRFFLSNLMADI